MSSILDELARRARAGQLGSSIEREPLVPKIYPPATSRQIADAEEQLGFRLPSLLRDIYLNVANGGFGPGYGFFPLSGGRDEHRERTLVETYVSFRYRPERVRWGEKLLPICFWGCCYYSYLDCTQPQTPVMAFNEDSHGEGPWGCASSPHAKSFEEWMQRWLDGEDLWQSFSAHGEPKFWEEERAADEAPVHLTRNYTAAADAVFDAWLTPDVARHWLFRRADADPVRMTADARLGGQFVIWVSGTGRELQYFGTYEKIERPRQLAFSLHAPAISEDVSRVLIHVTPTPSGSRLDLTHTGFPGRVVIGPWNYMLDALDRLLTTGR
jgi:uncharacterized protein YndB with AHSA1/START domain